MWGEGKGEREQRRKRGRGREREVKSGDCFYTLSNFTTAEFFFFFFFRGRSGFMAWVAAHLGPEPA